MPKIGVVSPRVAGASADIELAYTLCDGLEYIRTGEKAGLNIDDLWVRYCLPQGRPLSDFVFEGLNQIEVRNFGVLESKPTKAKPKARNPKTNEEIFVPAHKKTHFKPGKILKNYLKKPI